LQILEGNRDYLLKFLAEKIPQIKMTKPEATYLAWLDCRGIDLPSAPAKFFLERAKVGVNEGEEFGAQGKGFVRLNFGCSRATLREALERILRAI
jgi:cystathionine beta-lyase